MAGNIVRLGRGCPSQSVRDHPQTGVGHCHSLQAASRGEVWLHVSTQHRRGRLRTEHDLNPNAMILDADDVSGSLHRTCDVVMVLCPV